MAGKKPNYTLSKEALSDLKTARSRMGLSQEAVAEKIDKARLTYLRLETGQSNVISDTLGQVCRVLGLEPHIYMTAAGEGALDVKGLLACMQEKEREIEGLKRQVDVLQQEKRNLALQVELLMENRRLRQNKTEE